MRNDMEAAAGAERRPSSAVERFWEKPSVRRLRQIPKALHTSEMINAVLDRGEPGSLLKYASRRAVTEEQRKRAVAVHWSDLRYVAERHITPELARIAVSGNGCAIELVPAGLMTKELQELAVCTTGRALQYIPWDERTYDLCLKAVENDHASRLEEDVALEEVPPDLLQGEAGATLCEAAINTNGLALSAVPAEYLTEYLVWTAVKNDPCVYLCPVIRCVPKRFLSAELVELSLRVNPESIGGMKASALKYVTEARCRELIEEHPEAARFIPDKFYARDSLADFALERDPRLLGALPASARTRERCFSAKERDPEGVGLYWFPEVVREQWELEHCQPLITQPAEIKPEGPPATVVQSPVSTQAEAEHPVPRAWQFRNGGLEGKCDPFEAWEDGIYEITPEQFSVFQASRGVGLGYNRAETPYVAKHAGIYMFFGKQGEKEYWFAIGRRHVLDHPVLWYYNNMPRYAELVQTKFEPYRNALQAISDEIRLFGGSGAIWGGCVSIDLLDYVRLDPQNGKIMLCRSGDRFCTHKKMERLLKVTLQEYEDSLEDEKESAYKNIISRSTHDLWVEQSALIKKLLGDYESRNQEGALSLLGRENLAKGKSNKAIAIPEDVFNHELCSESQIDRSIQHLLVGDVISYWNDAVLEG